MKNLKILIVGYYGSDNAGDEMLLRATKKLLNKIYETPEITAITYNIKDTKEKHNINGISRNKYKDIFKGIKNADIVVGGGGSMLQNITSNRSLIYYLSILKISKLMGKKVVLLGNGIGPLKNKIAIKNTIKILNSLDGVVLRDEESFEFLKSKGLKNIELGNDLVFSLDFNANNQVEDKKIVFNIRKWSYGDGFLLNITNFIKYLSDEGFKVSLVSFQKGNDDVVLKEIEKNINSSNVKFIDTDTDEELIEEIASGKVFIGMRLHGLIFSSLVNVPFIALSYDPKVSVFANNQGQKFFDDLSNIKTEELIDEFKNIYGNIEQQKNILIDNTKKTILLNYVNENMLRTQIINEAR